MISAIEWSSTKQGSVQTLTGTAIEKASKRDILEEIRNMPVDLPSLRSPDTDMYVRLHVPIRLLDEVYKVLEETFPMYKEVPDDSFYWKYCGDIDPNMSC